MTKKPKFKVCRRLGPGVYEKCQTTKFASSAPKKGKSDRRPKALSGFAMQLLEKQKVRFSYGLSERQFSNYVKGAGQKKGTPPTDALFESLETRLDNVVYRMGLAHTRRLARQMVSHGHLVVNGVRTTVPSYHVKPQDVITIREGSKTSGLFANLAEKLKNYNAPAWLAFDLSTFEGKVTTNPKNTENFFDLNSVVEFYSR